MKNFLPAFVLALASCLAGCVGAHLDYPLGSVEKAAASPFGGRVLYVGKIADLRYRDRNSASSMAQKRGAYNEAVAFSKVPSDCREVFGDAPFDGAKSYYIAPDRLYWVSDGPLTELRRQCGAHLVKAGLFLSATEERTKADCILDITAKRFLFLKERRPFADGLGFLGMSSLFSGNEITAVEIDWRLLDAKTARLIESGTVKFSCSETKNNFRAKDRPFAMARAAAKRAIGAIAQDIGKAR